MNQRDGVFAAVFAVCGNFSGPILDQVTPDQKKEIYEMLTAEFQAGNIEYRGGCPDPDKLAKYIPGLVNNWMRKDPRLNGNVKYEAKNPGSRQGSGDASLKNMKLLLKMVTDPIAKQKIQEEIDKKVAEIEAAKRPVLDVNKIPEHLRQFLPQ